MTRAPVRTYYRGFWTVHDTLKLIYSEFTRNVLFFFSFFFPVYPNPPMTKFVQIDDVLYSLGNYTVSDNF